MVGLWARSMADNSENKVDVSDMMTEEVVLFFNSDTEVEDFNRFNGHAI